MNDTSLWNVRMRAAKEIDGTSHHLSGAERVVKQVDLEITVAEMLRRAQVKNPETIHLTAESIPLESFSRTRCLDITTLSAQYTDDAARYAVFLLERAGITRFFAEECLLALFEGLGPKNSPLRGASIWDIASGDRLEADRSRGVRVSRFDYSEQSAPEIDNALERHGLTHFRTREALALATKAQWSGAIAEVCWSDDEEYSTGYVSAQPYGYVRITNFKPAGAIGGRVLFVNRADISPEQFSAQLERSPLLIDGPLNITGPVTIDHFQDDK